MSTMTPREIVHELDKHIIGQSAAKRAVAIALRNRWRRAQLEAELREEVTPKNILMIGPTGVGKTEIARRLAKLADAPFIKVEATKFTEVGYVGRDVESIIRDLVDTAIAMVRDREMSRVQHRAEEAAEDRILDSLLPPARGAGESQDENDTRQKFRKMLREGKLDEREIEIDVSSTSIGMYIKAPPGMEELTSQIRGMFQNLNQQKSQTRRLKIAEAFKLLVDEEAANLIDDEEVKTAALDEVEQNAIVFIDEIDKVAKRSSTRALTCLGKGVQRTFYPRRRLHRVDKIRHGSYRPYPLYCLVPFTFRNHRTWCPNWGRLPIRVELDALTAHDFERILTEPDASLTEQYSALLRTESVELSFGRDAIERLAQVAFQVNESTENIGARRLHTIMERLLEALSFDASDRSGETIEVDAAYVEEQLAEMAGNEDLSRYIL